MNRLMVFAWIGMVVTVSIAGCKKPGAPYRDAARDFSTSFWVWHRESPLPPDESEALKALGVQRLFWHMADYDPMNAARPWRIREFQPADAAVEVVPVLRIAPGGALLEHADRIASLKRMLPNFAPWSQEVQIDYDCPVRLLPEYARALLSLREAIRPRRLSVTALAGWIDSPDFARMERSVDGIYPMFYDLVADAPEAVRAGQFEPLCDAARHENWIRKWKNVKVSWYAGLPNFTRWSLFDSAGQLKGHLPSWQWDELVFHPDLTLLESESRAGVFVFRCDQPTDVARTRMTPGDMLVWRSVPGEHLLRMVDSAKASGAAGVVFFRLPGDGAPNAWSTSHLLSLQSAFTGSRDPALESLELRREADGALRLENPGPRDVPPRFAGRDGLGDRGWKLEIEAENAGWASDAAPGEFVRMAGYQDPIVSGATPVHPGRARRLTFWFSGLAAGSHLTTGPIWMKHPEHIRGLRWRVDDEAWRTVP